jgi:hypothetical protein
VAVPRLLSVLVRRKEPRNRHVLARVAQNSERKHFKDKEAETVLGMKFVVVYKSSVKINAFAVEGALQRALQHIPLGRRVQGSHSIAVRGMCQW